MSKKQEPKPKKVSIKDEIVVKDGEEKIKLTYPDGTVEYRLL